MSRYGPDALRLFAEQQRRRRAALERALARRAPAVVLAPEPRPDGGPVADEEPVAVDQEPAPVEPPPVAAGPVAAPGEPLAVGQAPAPVEPPPVAPAPAAAPEEPPSMVIGPRPLLPTHQLRGIGGEAAGQVFLLHRGATSIGRAPDNDITLQEQEISRHHAVITVTDGRVTVEDIGSRNGTKVNGAEIGEVIELTPGDQIGVGFDELRLEQLEEGFEEVHVDPPGDEPAAAQGSQP